MLMPQGGKGQARIGIITAGRDDVEESAKELKVWNPSLFFLVNFTSYSTPCVKAILMSHGARNVTWIPVSGSSDDSGNDEAAAALVTKQSAIFIDDGDAHRLLRLLRNPDGSGFFPLFCEKDPEIPFDLNLNI